MHEIDLIPPEHRRQRRLRRALQHALLALLLLLTATAAARAWLGLQLARERPVLAAMQARAQATAALRAERQALAARLELAEALWSRLQSLRAGAGWRHALAGIDQAHSPRIWLDQVDASAPRASLPAVAAGPANAASAAATAAPSAGQLAIKGHALDHAAVMAFVQALDAHPGIAEVRLASTGVRQYSTTQVLDFELRAALVDERSAAR